MMTNDTHCDCGDSFATYKCCGERDAARMIETGRATLYLTGQKVTNWPGTLEFPVLSRSVSRHNWGIPRTDFWFRGPDGFIWHGYQIGDNSQIARGRRTKRRQL